MPLIALKLHQKALVAGAKPRIQLGELIMLPRPPSCFCKKNLLIYVITKSDDIFCTVNRRIDGPTLSLIHACMQSVSLIKNRNNIGRLSAKPAVICMSIYPCRITDLGYIVKH
jgi:hypothetical protein